MKFQKLKLVTVIADSAIANQIEKQMQVIGAKNLTKTDLKDDKVQFQSTVLPSIATQIIKFVCEENFDYQSVIAYAVETDVIQPEKFKSGVVDPIVKTVI